MYHHSSSTTDHQARNIYYQDPALFRSQEVVNRYVDVLAYTFGLRRADLHVVSQLAGNYSVLITQRADSGSKRSHRWPCPPDV